MKKLIVLLLLFSWGLNAQIMVGVLSSSLNRDNANNVTEQTPIIYNFIINDSSKDRVYFDVIGDISAMTTSDFVISNKTISAVNIEDNYFTVSSAFTFWDNNTIRLENDNVIYSFTLEYIANNILEPESTGTQYYVDAAATGTGSGLSEVNAFTTIQAGFNAASTGSIIWVKAGTYTTTSHGETNGFSATPTNPVKVIGYKNTPGDIISNYYSFTQGSAAPALDASEMPLMEGNDVLKYAILCEDNNVIFKNLQFHGYAAGILGNGRTNIVIENCNSNRMLGSGSSKYSGFSLNAPLTGATSYLTPSNFRVINSYSVNAGMASINVKGSGSLIDNCQTYSDIESSALSTDYFITIAGSNSIVRNSTAIAKNDLISGGSHGLGVKSGPLVDADGGSKSEYNLFQNCYVNTGGNEGLQARNWGADYNVFKDIEIKGLDGGYGISIQSGARNNIFERIYMHDLAFLFTYKGGTEQGSATDKQAISGNIIRNCIGENTTYMMSNFISLNVMTPFEDNKIENCTFLDITAMNLGAEPSMTYMSFSGNAFVNCIFDNINTENAGANHPTLQEMWSIDSSVFNGSGTWASNVPAWATNSLDINPTYTSGTNFTPTNESLRAGSSVSFKYDYYKKERKTNTTIGAISLDSEVAESGAIAAYIPDYYIKNSGNDLADGLTDATAWETLTKASTAPTGSIIAFKGGDEWYGTLTKDYATWAVTLTSYGTGQAIFKGTEPITGFTDEGSNIWKASTTGKTVYHVLQNNEIIGAARLPKIISDLTPLANYYVPTSVSSTTVFISSDLIGQPDLVGANCFVKDYAENIEKRTITSFNSGTGQVTLNSAVSGLSTSDYFFVQNHKNLVTQIGDWSYDSSTDELFIYGTSLPTNIEAITLNGYGLHLEGTSNVVVDNIKFKGYKLGAAYLESGTGYQFKNNSFYGLMDFGIRGSSVSTLLVDNNHFKDGQNYSTYISGFGTVDLTFTNNLVENIGLLSDLSYTGFSISSQTGTGVLIFNGNASNNIVRNTGYNGFAFYGGGTLQNNLIQNTCLTSHDGGGVYTYEHSNYSAIGQTIQNNIITSDLIAVGTWVNYGIYSDDNSTGILVLNNAISGHSTNIFSHNNQNNTFNYNVSYGSRNASILFKNDVIGNDYSGNNVFYNEFYMNNSVEAVLKVNNQDGSSIIFGSSDFNKYYNTELLDVVEIIATGDTSYNTLSEWQSKSSLDVNTLDNSLLTITAQTFEYNFSSKIVSKSLVGTWYDLDNNVYIGAINIPAYSGKILIQK